MSSTDRRGAPLVTLLCKSCGHVFNDPVPSADELAAFYAKAYRVSYKGAARPRGRQIARNFGRVEKFWSRWGHLVRNHPRVLDVGAGSGEFLFFAQSLGYDASGVEPNVDYANFCRNELGLPVRTASIEDLHADASTYDFIRLNHVLEHLRDPVGGARADRSAAVARRASLRRGAGYLRLRRLEIEGRHFSLRAHFELQRVDIARRRRPRRPRRSLRRRLPA